MVEYPNVVEELQGKAAEARETSAPRCSRQADSRAKGLEYAAGFIAGRVEKIQAELKQAREAADEEPLDAQERERQTELFGVVLGLEKALAILGVES